MSADVINNLHNRCASLEDIIRQQEQTLSAVLGRLRDVEQRFGSEQHAKESTQQQINALLNDRSATAAQIDHLNNALGNQSDRLSNVEAGHQGIQSAVQGVDQKYDAVSRGLENRLQGDIQAVQQRLQASEQATGEAIRSVQGGVQGNTNAIQTVDTNTRASLEGLQQQMTAEVANMRQRVEQLEAGMRQALQEVHGGLTNDIRTANQATENLLRTALQSQNEALLALDERVRGELTQLNTQEQTDAADLRRRIEDLDNTSRQSVQNAHTSLSKDITDVSQLVQALDSRQRTAHQDLIQELSKHDQQMETIDVNWRASVVDLSGKMEADNRTIQQQFQAGDLNIQSQLNGLQERFVMVSDSINKNLNDMGTTIQERCVVPLEITNTAVTRHGERINKLGEDSDAVREFLRVFSQEVDKNNQQVRQAIDSAIRASHTDLLERINVLSAATALHADPDQVYTQINEALTAIWGDVSSTFTTQRDLNGIQSQIATLESAIREEIFAMAQKNNEMNNRLQEVTKGGVSEPPTTRSPTGGLSSSNVSSHGENVSNTSREQLTIVKEVELDMERIRGMADDVANYAKAAEDAQNRCLTAVNENRAILDNMANLREQLLRQQNDMDNAMREQLRDLDARLKSTEEMAAAPSPKKRKQSSGYPPLYAQAAEAAAPKPLEAHDQSSQPQSMRDIHRISGTFNKNDFLVRSTEGRASQSTPVIMEDGRTTPSEILLPTHQFVRKKEFGTHKSFMQNEIDSIWKELLNVRKNSLNGGGISREEVLLLEAKTKEEVANRTMEVLDGQEREFKRLLELIRLQVNGIRGSVSAPGLNYDGNYGNPAENQRPSQASSPRRASQSAPNDRRPTRNSHNPVRASKPEVVETSRDQDTSSVQSEPLPVQVYRPPRQRNSSGSGEDPSYYAESSEPPRGSDAINKGTLAPPRGSYAFPTDDGGLSPLHAADHQSPYHHQVTPPLNSEDHQSPRYPSQTDYSRDDRKSMGHGDPNNHYPLYSEMQEPANHPYSVQVIPDHVIQPTHDGEPPIEPIVGSLSESPRYSAYDAQSPFHQHSPKEQPRYSAYDAQSPVHQPKEQPRYSAYDSQSPVHQHSPNEQPRYSAYDAQSPFHQQSPNEQPRYSAYDAQSPFHQQSPKEQPLYSAYDAQSPFHQQSPKEQPRYSAYDAQSPVHQHSSNQLPLTSYEEQPSHPYQSSQHSNHSNMIDLNDVLPEGDEHYTELLESPPDSSDDNERSDNRSLREGSPPGSHPVPMNQIPENLQHGYNPPMAFPQPNGYNPMPMQGGYTPQVPLPQLPFFAGQPYSENAGPRASSAGTQKEPQYRFTPSLYAPSAQQTTANLLAQVNELERQLNRLNQAGRLPNSAPVNRDEEFLRQMGDPRKNPVASGHHLTPMDDRRPSKAVPRSSVSQGSKPPSAGKRRKSHKNQPSEQYDDDEVEHRRKQRSRSAPEKRHHSISPEGRRSAGAERRPSAHERRPSARPSPERRQSAPSPDNAPFDPTTTQSYQRAASPINKSGMTSSPTPGYEEDSRHSTPVPVRVLDSDSSQGIPTPVPQAGPIRVVVPGHAYKVPSSAPAPIRIAPK